MRPDKEDMPTYLRSKKETGPWRMVAILGVGSAITWGVIALFAKPIVINVDQLKQAIHVDGKPLFSQQPAPQPYSEPEEPIRLASIPIDSPAQNVQPYQQTQAIEWTEQSGQVAGELRQTDFNDQNYTPRLDVNTMAAPPAIYYASSKKTRTEEVRRNNYSYWTWIGADRKKTRIRIEWETINGWIEYDTVCHNHRKGSIIYRDCRKAAKEYFVHRCRTESRKAFCRAENGFNPL